jgi:cellulose synthase (UDP-forming)
MHHDYPTLYGWAALTVVVCAAAPVHVAARQAAETLPLQLARMRSVLGNRRLGDTLIARGALTNGQLRNLLGLQARREQGWLRLGELAVQEGYISEAQLTEALRPAGQLTPQLGNAT